MERGDWKFCITVRSGAPCKGRDLTGGGKPRPAWQAAASGAGGRMGPPLHSKCNNGGFLCSFS